jgi:flagellar hook-associated protein 2
MSTSSVTTGTISNTNGLLQDTGLATGLDTNAIIQAELSVQELPLSNMASEIAGLRTVNSQLTSIQSGLQTVSLDAQALGDVTLFSPVQTVSSTNSSLVTATSTSGIGGVIGSSVVEVDSLAGAAQRTFAFTSPSSADTVTIDGQQVNLAAGASSSDLAQSINSNSNLDVWASATSSGQLVLSSRTTGQQSGSYIAVSDTGGALVEDPTKANAGANAQYQINGVAGSSPTDTVTGAIPGVTLTLNGVTSTTNPVTVTVNPPAPDADSIVAAIKQFVSDYNSSVNAIGSAVNTQPANSSTGGAYDPNGGSLFGDNDLAGFLSLMRTSMYTPGSGLPAGLAALSDIGITTGAATAGGSSSSSSIAGNLTIDTAKLTAAIQNNPNAVKSILQSWSQGFQATVNNEAQPGGTLDARIQGNNTLSTSLNSRYTTLQEQFANEQKAMQQQWAQIEATISTLKQQQSYLTNYMASISTSSSSTSSGG